MQLKKTLVSIAMLCSVVSFTANAETKSVSLKELYESYVNNNYSTLTLPEYNKPVEFSGIVIRKSNSLAGNIIIVAGTSNSDDELARLTWEDNNQSDQLGELQVNSKFTAECILGFASNADYIPFNNCELK